nr:ATP-binding protein [uncultured Tyzzerella sp.]
MSSNLITLFLLQFNYKTKIKDKILLVLYIILILIIVDTVTVIITNKLILPMNIKSEYNSIIGWGLQLFLSYILLKSLKNFEDIKLMLDMPNIFWIPLTMIPLTSIFLITLFLYMGKDNIVLVLIAFIGFAIINIIVFLLYKFLIDDIKNKLEYKLYLKQFNILKEKYLSLEIIRHDLKKHLKYIKQLSLEKNTNKIIEYLDYILNEVDLLEKLNINSGNTVIDSILNFKFKEIAKNSINLNYNILIPYDLDISPFDMVCLLENLLDNVIEANLKIENKEERYLKMNMEYINNSLLIVLENSFKDINLDKNNNIITSKKDIFNNGFGLKSIKKIVNKYNGNIKIEINDNKFITEIILIL